MHRRLPVPLLLPIALTFLLGEPARAGCCRVVKVDAETATERVRVCADGGGGVCGGVLYEGPLPLGSAREVCTDLPTLVYEEWDAIRAAYGPPTIAVCDGGDVEL